MNGLKLLSTYSSDDESSEELQGESCDKNTGHEICEKNSLPLPQEIKTMFGNSEDNAYDDCTAEHNDKIRSFPHERGVWATFVYIEYAAEPEFHILLESFKAVSLKHNINMSHVDHFHVSLSRTLKLKYHWIPVFVESLKKELMYFSKFKIMLQSPEVYLNEEKTRTFLGLKVYYGIEKLENILRKIDKCLEEFSLPFFYQDPSFHLSCVSSVGDHLEKVNSFITDLNVAFLSFIDDHPPCKTIWVKDIKIKTGNKFFTIPFKS